MKECEAAKAYTLALYNRQKSDATLKRNDSYFNLSIKMTDAS